MSKAWTNGSDTRWRKLRAYVLAGHPACALCGLPGADSVDHVVSLANGGAKYDLSNCRPAHTQCNSRRGDGKGEELEHKTITEW